MKTLTTMFLNVHGGITFDTLSHYLAKMASSIDVFCFQEVPSSPTRGWQFHPNTAKHNLYQELEIVLPQHQGYYHPCQSNRQKEDNRLSYPFSFGLSTFVNRSISNVQVFSKRIHTPKAEYLVEKHGTVPRDLYCVSFPFQNSSIVIANMHGLWDAAGKVDTNERRLQMLNTVYALRQFGDTPVILGGDFNILPASITIKMLETMSNFRNLVDEYGVTNTRSKTQYLKEVRFADYVFLSPSLNILHFMVDETADAVSDHLPLILSVEA